jgi:alpha/beta hydrolase fold
MTRFILTLVLISTITSRALADPSVIHLWDNGAPGFESLKDQPEIAKDWWVRNINNPSLTVYEPAPGKANGCAMIIAPGGGLHTVNFPVEGEPPAEYLASLGVTCFALKYRLPAFDDSPSPYKMENVRQDIFRAMRLLRHRANQFQIDPNRIGVLGFSAGVTVVTMVSLHDASGDPKASDPVDRESARPNFQILVYPGGIPEIIPADAPPALLVCANDDDYGCDKITLRLFEQLRNTHIPVEAYFIQQGKHAFNIGRRSPYLAIQHWPDRMADWLNDRGFLVPSTPGT